MSANELKWIGSGSDRTLILGAVPKLSIDPRIRCPRTFTEENPPPPPPNERYGEIACRAASKILNASWSFRSYVEVIKVGYLLDDQSSGRLYLTGEIVLVEPDGNKINVMKSIAIGSRSGWISCDDPYSRANLMTLALTGPEQAYEEILCSFVSKLVEKTRDVVRRKTDEYASHIADIRTFQELVAGSSD